MAEHETRQADEAGRYALHQQVKMLTLPDGQWRHAQPMTAFVDGRDLWFFTPTDSKLALSIGTGREAVFVFQAKDLYACLSGTLTLSHDEARIALTFSAGVALQRPRETFESLLKRADLAMYGAKREGKDRSMAAPD